MIFQWLYFQDTCSSQAEQIQLLKHRLDAANEKLKVNVDESFQSFGINSYRSVRAEFKQLENLELLWLCCIELVASIFVALVLLSLTVLVLYRSLRNTLIYDVTLDYGSIYLEL